MKEITTPDSMPAEVKAIWAKSTGHLLAIMFGQSPAKSYAQAVAFAKTADFYEEAELEDGSFVHAAVFAKNQKAAATARSLLKIIKGWKTTSVYSSNRGPLKLLHITSVLDCYLESFGSKKPEHHCHTIETVLPPIEDYLTASGSPVVRIDPFAPAKFPEYRSPCRWIRGFVGHAVNYKGDRTLAESMLSMGIRHGCEWCPNFNPEILKKV